MADAHRQGEKEKTEMSGRLAGKRAVVTGAAQGIGLASTEAFAREGAEVIAVDVNDGMLSKIKMTGVRTRRLDVRDGEAIRIFSGTSGPVDILFNCAGCVHSGDILAASDDSYDVSFDLNVRSQFLMIRAFLPAMVARGKGSIINMSSVAGVPAGVPQRCVYSASKAAVIGLTRSVAIDFVKSGIRCNAIAPGTVQSPSLEERMQAQENYEQARAAFVARQPMGRLGLAEEIAELAVYLASDLSAYTTGHVHVIDGGLSL